ncbi:mitogen-activated protein kinase kinase kinase 1, partial [Plakobranchus ocellatus]
MASSSSVGTDPSFSAIGASEVEETGFVDGNRIERSGALDERVRSGTSYEEKFQGPHKWRRQLRHVPSKRLKNSRPNKDKTDCLDEDASSTVVSLRRYKEHFDTSTDTATSRNDRPNDVDPLDLSLHNLSIQPDDDSPLPEQGSSNPISPWSKEFSNHRKLYKQNANGTGGQASQIPVTVRRRGSLHGVTESAFTRQVVNSGQSSSTARKKLSTSSSFRHANNPNTSAIPGRRTASQQNIEVSSNTDLTKKRIDRVLRARLYLLQQTGPNSFLIGGDSPDHKYRVIIGPQTCSCGRGPHCVHVLFVMLRVFQVGENNPCLWSKTLKNFEVENLFRIYHDKRSSRIKRRRPSQRKKSMVKEEIEGEGEEEASADVTDSSRMPSESDTGSVREEEDTCPICLLEMLEGESLIRCENGCHNRLHHHCIAIWFEECRRQNDPLNCPLCRAQWKTTTVEIKSTQGNGNTEGPDVPPNTRVSSPQPPSSGGDTGRLPHAEPIPPEMEETAAPWVEALGPELVGCLLSRNWSIREAGLKHLSKEVMATLMRGAGEGRPGAIVSPVRRAATHSMLQTTCNILAYTCADPVYRVFVASLRSIRTLLSYTPCRDAEQRARLQATLKPVVEAIILKCTDGNRRTSQLSLSTLVELVKGQEGELALGREIHNPGSEGIDGLNYVLKCVTEDYDLETVPWQWLLGRLYTIDRLLEEFPSNFLPRPEESPDAAGAAEPDSSENDCASSASGARPTAPDDELGEASSNYQRLMSVAHFSVKAVCSAHMRIARMSRRVFLLSAKLGAHVGQVISELKDLLSQINSSSVASLGRKLDRIVEDFHLSEKIVHELMHGSDGSKRSSGKQDGLSMSPNCYSPADSPCSSPRCNSPVTSTSSPSHHIPNLSDFINSDTGPRCTSEKSAPVPPNTPNTQRVKRKLRRAIPRRNLKDVSSGIAAPPPTSENSPEKNSVLQVAGDQTKVEYPESTNPERPVTFCSAPRLSPMLTRLGSASPPNRRRSNLPLRRKTIEGDKVSKRAGSSSPTIRRRTVDGSGFPSNSTSQSQTPPGSSRASASPARTPPTSLAILPDIPAIAVTDTSSHLSVQNLTSNFSPAVLSDLDENVKETTEETDVKDRSSEQICNDNHVAQTSLFTVLKSSAQEQEDHLEFQPSEASKVDPASPSPSPQQVLNHSEPSTCCGCKCHLVENHEAKSENHEAAYIPSTPPSGTAGVPNTPESAGKTARRGSGHYHTSEHESMSSDDFLEFSSQEGGGTGDQSVDDKPVSFRTEVANSPKSSPSHSVHSGASSKSGGECGTCKEEVEREEAEALAQALAVSERQDPCPVVPGLTPTSREEVITIRIQPDT